jgi:hypothetical protein
MIGLLQNLPEELLRIHLLNIITKITAGFTRGPLTRGTLIFILSLVLKSREFKHREEARQTLVKVCRTLGT